MAKKPAAKAADAKAADKPAVPGKVKAATKAEIFSAIATKTGLAKKDVANVFDAFVDWSKKELGKKGPGVILVPGMAKIKAVRKAATKAKSMANPFKPGEMMTVKAKPARTGIKIVALKAYKDAL